ncbi:APC family permease [Halovenus halobia]|uniref:APC family permease n=1 Tax=Halovenus halobia TaxID=3396622 RepID=UPI003F568056
MSRSNSSQGGEESIGLLDAVVIEVGLIIGGALFALVGVGVSVAGAGVLVSFGIAITIATLGLVPTAMLGAAFPTTCGHYQYPKRFVGNWLAFAAAWGLGVSMFTGGLPLYALTAGQYLDPLLPVSPEISGFGVLTVFFVLNLFGIRPAARAQLLMFVGLLVALGSFILFGIPAVEPVNLTPLFAGNSLGILAGAGLLYFTCLGANFVIDLGGDLRDATVTIPRSFMIAIPLVFVLYISVTAVSVGTIGVEAMAGQTLATPAEQFLSPAFQTVFVVFGALFAIATSLNAAFILVPRYAQALASDGIFPAAFAATNDRYGTAHWALLGTYLLSAGAVFAPLPFEDMGALLGLGGAFIVTIVMLAAIVVIRTQPDDFNPDVVPVPTQLILVMAVLAVPLNLLLIVLLASQTVTLFVGWLLALAVGLLYYALRMNYADSPGIAVEKEL